MKRMCECEHEDHPAEGHTGDPAQHPYGMSHHERDLTPVKTVFGTFMICRECNTKHPIPEKLLQGIQIRIPDDAPHASAGGRD